MKRGLLVAALLPAALAAPAAAQDRVQRLSVEPFVGYGFFGKVPEASSKLKEGLVYGGRAGLRLTRQWGVFGDFRRSTPGVIGTLPLGFEVDGGEITVDHWSAGLEFAYFARGGAEGMLPVILQAGIGEVRYEGGQNDRALNLGISSAAALSRNLAIRYAINDYISNFNRDQGRVHQVFVTVGGEMSF